jgi:hypothetical protein
MFGDGFDHSRPVSCWFNVERCSSCWHSQGASSFWVNSSSQKKKIKINDNNCSNADGYRFRLYWIVVELEWQNIVRIRHWVSYQNSTFRSWGSIKLFSLVKNKKHPHFLNNFFSGEIQKKFLFLLEKKYHHQKKKRVYFLHSKEIQKLWSRKKN